LSTPDKSTIGAADRDALANSPCRVSFACESPGAAVIVLS
jgi:hypothetical protein